MTVHFVEAAIMDEMGIFRTTVGIAALGQPGTATEIADVMVDTGSEYSWFPEALLAQLGVVSVRVDRFETADGSILERPVGFAVLYAGGQSAASMVVFGEPGDMVLLGAHGLEGMNLRVDLGRRELVPAGPLPAALAA
jgi:predicted aspartyl protease